MSNTYTITPGDICASYLCQLFFQIITEYLGIFLTAISGCKFSYLVRSAYLMSNNEKSRTWVQQKIDK